MRKKGIEGICGEEKRQEEERKIEKGKIRDKENEENEEKEKRKLIAYLGLFTAGWNRSLSVRKNRSFKNTKKVSIIVAQCENQSIKLIKRFFMILFHRYSVCIL